ncbi:MAG: DUF4058 family protein [Verrucomicrobiota bacterium]
MKNPFPGMNPWLEGYWGDMHLSLLTYIRDQIQSQLPGNLYAQGEMSVTVDEYPENPARYVPDVSILDAGGDGGAAVMEQADTLVATKPKVVRVEKVPERWIQIYDLDSNNEVVTAIEVLSPTNKDYGKGREQYLAKQDRYYHSKVNLVEIDLLRGGLDSFIVGERLRSEAEYGVCVTRGMSSEVFECYPMHLREPLSNIAIPLRREDKDVVLPLQKIINHCYEMGRYHHKIDYSRQPRLQLETSDWEWTRTMVSE